MRSFLVKSRVNIEGENIIIYLHYPNVKRYKNENTMVTLLPDTDF